MSSPLFDYHLVIITTLNYYSSSILAPTCSTTLFVSSKFELHCFIHVLMYSYRNHFLKCSPVSFSLMFLTFSSVRHASCLFHRHFACHLYWYLYSLGSGPGRLLWRDLAQGPTPCLVCWLCLSCDGSSPRRSHVLLWSRILPEPPKVS